MSEEEETVLKAKFEKNFISLSISRGWSDDQRYWMWEAAKFAYDIGFEDGVRAHMDPNFVM